MIQNIESVQSVTEQEHRGPRKAYHVSFSNNETTFKSLLIPEIFDDNIMEPTTHENSRNEKTTVSKNNTHYEKQDSDSVITPKTNKEKISSNSLQVPVFKTKQKISSCPSFSLLTELYQKD